MHILPAAPTAPQVGVTYSCIRPVSEPLRAEPAAVQTSHMVRIVAKRRLGERSQVLVSVPSCSFAGLLLGHRRLVGERPLKSTCLVGPSPPVARSTRRLVVSVLLDRVLEPVVGFAAARKAAGQAPLLRCTGEGLEGVEAAATQDGGDVCIAPRRPGRSTEGPRSLAARFGALHRRHEDILAAGPQTNADTLQQPCDLAGMSFRMDVLGRVRVLLGGDVVSAVLGRPDGVWMRLGRQPHRARASGSDCDLLSLERTELPHRWVEVVSNGQDDDPCSGP